jgi:DNA replication protein DnaC
VVGDVLTAELAEKQARSIRHQLTIAKLPLAKDIDHFEFDGTPIKRDLVRDLAGGGSLTQQRNMVLVGGTGTGNSHLVIAVAAQPRVGRRRRARNPSHPRPAHEIVTGSRLSI